jgi:hypothetical protein
MPVSMKTSNRRAVASRTAASGQHRPRWRSARRRSDLVQPSDPIGATRPLAQRPGRRSASKRRDCRSLAGVVAEVDASVAPGPVFWNGQQPPRATGPWLLLPEAIRHCLRVATSASAMSDRPASRPALLLARYSALIAPETRNARQARPVRCRRSGPSGRIEAGAFATEALGPWVAASRARPPGWRTARVRRCKYREVWFAR